MAQGTVFLVEDDDAVREAIGLYLSSKDLHVRTFSNAASCLDELNKPGLLACVVSDVKMRGMSGIELQRRMAVAYPGTPLILITGHGDIAMAVDALRTGAHDFLEKPLNLSRLHKSILEALARRRSATRAAGQRLTLQQRAATLTEREVEVMDLAVAGKTNREIAEVLGISYRTVEIHRGRVMAKMEAATLAELVKCALVLKHE